ncbi:MAG: hypothetical protein H0W25_21035, partial [Acidimicrobiia bacterium]|nr:hypothetical protein [Acidimicrobiia bacterium]
MRARWISVLAAFVVGLPLAGAAPTAAQDAPGAPVEDWVVTFERGTAAA